MKYDQAGKNKIKSAIGNFENLKKLELKVLSRIPNKNKIELLINNPKSVIPPRIKCSAIFNFNLLKIIFAFIEKIGTIQNSIIFEYFDTKSLRVFLLLFTTSAVFF